MPERITSGIQGFDELIDGGFPRDSIILVSGTPGTGKSIFCAQVLFANAMRGKKCLYLDLEQKEEKIATQMRQFGWDIEKVSKNMKIVAVDALDPNMVEFIVSEIQKVNYDLIALDSLDSISSSPMFGEEKGKIGMEKIGGTMMPILADMTAISRLKLKRIFTAISKSRSTAFLTSERVENAPGLSRDTISEFLCDGIVLMHYLGFGGSELRSMQILKMRLTNHTKDYLLFEIEKNGIKLKKREDAFKV